MGRSAPVFAVPCRFAWPPARTLAVLRTWHNVAIRGCRCTWAQLPDALRAVLPQLGWV